MSTQNDLLNGNNNKNESLASEGPEHTKMCSNCQDDSDNMFPYYEDDTRGDHSINTKGEWLEIAVFRHFERHTRYEKKGRKPKNKKILHEIEVSVFVHV